MRGRRAAERWERERQQKSLCRFKVKERSWRERGEEEERKGEGEVEEKE